MDSFEYDLNTAEALGHVFTALKAVKPEALSPVEALAVWRGFHLILAAFGIVLPPEKADEEVPAAVRAVAEARWAARTSKDWAEADRLRGELDALGWTMKDGRENYTLSLK
jgi:cysteinyl-tRNA synthetase